MPIEWYGEQVTARVQKAAAEAIDETMGECVVHAKSNYYEGHGLRSSTLQGSIEFRPAEIRRMEVVGYWGSFDVKYAEHVEQGTVKMEGQHQLQNAADEEYPKLAGRIRRRLA